MEDLDEKLSVRTFRMGAVYAAARLKALEETQHLAGAFEEAADKFALLEEEEGDLAVRWATTLALVETADGAWDDTILAFRRRLLEQVGHNTEAELYRRYFAEIPSQVTSLSYVAEIMISKELEAHLADEPIAELQSFSARLAEKRAVLEARIQDRVRLEVEQARFANRVALAKQILNKLRRGAQSNLGELAAAHGRDETWAAHILEGGSSGLSFVEEVLPEPLD